MVLPVVIIVKLFSRVFGVIVVLHSPPVERVFLCCMKYEARVWRAGVCCFFVKPIYIYIKQCGSVVRACGDNPRRRQVLQCVIEWCQGFRNNCV